MGILELIILALGLSMDSFAVSVTSGVVLKRFLWMKSLKIAFFLAFFQAVMPLIGWLIGREFKPFIEACDHWIAFLVLFFLGTKMVIEALKRDQDDSRSSDPSGTRTLLGLSLATSIDALAIGVSLAFLGMDMTAPVIIIGLVTLFCSLIGIYVGVKFGRCMKSKAEVLGGVILICIGLKIVIEHLFFS